MPLVSLLVLDKDEKRIPLQLLAVPEIASFMQHRPSAEIYNTQLQQLHLAHPLERSEWFTVSLLIGADYYWDFVADDIIRIVNGPTAVSSRLGYLLSGPVKTDKPTSSTSALFISAHRYIATNRKKWIFNVFGPWSQSVFQRKIATSLPLLSSPKTISRHVSSSTELAMRPNYPGETTPLPFRATSR